MCCLPEAGDWRHSPKRERDTDTTQKMVHVKRHKDSESEKRQIIGGSERERKNEGKECEMVLLMLVKERKSTRLRQRRGA